MSAFNVAVHLDFINLLKSISMLLFLSYVDVMFNQFLETTHDGDEIDHFLSGTTISYTSILSSHCLVSGVRSVLLLL